MIRINLLPVKAYEQAAQERQELSLVALGLVLLVLLLVAVRFHQGRVARGLDEQATELEQALIPLNEKVKEVSELENDRKELDAKLDVISELQRKRVGPVYVLDDLSEATPERLWLTEMTEFNGAVTLQGQAVDNQTIAAFLRSLSTSPYFTDVDLVETTEANVNDVRLRRFLIKAKVDYAATRVSAPAASGGGAAADAAAPGAADEAAAAADEEAGT